MSNTTETLVEQLTSTILSEVRRELADQGWFQVEASGRHIHLATADAKALFGEDYALIWAKYLSQPGQFVSEQRVSLVGPQGRLEGAVIIGPERSRTQIEVSATDALQLGLKPPCRDSGNLDDTPGIRLEYGSNSIETNGGVIIAERHIHMKPDAARSLGLSDGDRVDFVMDSSRPLAFMDVKVRVADTADNFMHIDYDEANAAGFETGMFGFICKDCNISGRRVCMDTEKLIDEVVKRLVAQMGSQQLGGTSAAASIAGSGTKAVDGVSGATASTGCGCGGNKTKKSGNSVPQTRAKKQLITETEAMGIAPNSHVSYPRGTIITPLAKDAFKERGITVAFE